MNTNKQPSFLPLYWKGIWDQDSDELPKGLISIPGPTGMGKTTTIAKELIPKLPDGVKVIYLTHRLRLTADFCNSCAESDLLGEDSFRQDMGQKDNLLRLENGFVERLQKNGFAELIPTRNRAAWFEKLDRLMRQFQTLCEETPRDKGLQKMQNDQIGLLGSQMYRQVIDTLKSSPSEDHQSVKEDYRSRRETPLIQALHSADIETMFPSIPWYLGGIQILAMTTQKFLKAGINYGVRVCYPDDLRDAVLFIDEFDYQEAEILNYLTSRPQVQNPINCIRLLVNGIEKLTKAHPSIFSSRAFEIPESKLSEIREKYPEIAEKPLEQLCGNPSHSLSDWREQVRNVTGKKIAKLLLDRYGEKSPGHAIVELCNRVREKFKNSGIEWEAKRFQLRLTEEKPSKQPFVFQSVHLLADHIDLYQDEDFWYVQQPLNETGADKIELTQFYGTLQSAIQNLNGIMTTYRHRQDFPLFGTILQVCFDDANDNSPSFYSRYFNEIYPAGLVRKLFSEDDNEGERVPDFYTTGFCLHFFEPQDTLEQPNNIASDHLYQVETSPEAIIAGLARRNLVYGLSATNHLRRIVNSFDLTWLENELWPEAEQGDLLLRLEPEDWQKELLQNLQEKKDDIRGEPLGAYNSAIEPDQSKWDQFTQCIRTHLGHLSEFNSPFRVRRILLFLETLEWISTKSKHVGHLVFMQSFRQIQRAFDSDARLELPWPSWCILQDQTGKDWDRILIHNKLINVVYYNSDFDRRLREDPQLKSDSDDLFSDGFVVLLTTQNTIANGANLEHPGKDSQPIDYGAIHILELPFYAFNCINFHDSDEISEEDPHEAKRQDCYRLAKARANRLLGEGAFRQHLRSRLPFENTVDGANSWYRKTIDYKLNALASIVQSIGRITRKWSESSPSEIRLCTEAEEIILDISESEELAGVISENRNCYSSLMQEVIQRIRDNAQLDVMKLHRYPTFKSADSAAKQQLSWILDAIEKVKANELSEEDAIAVRQGWRRLHKALLLHEREFECKLPGGRFLRLQDFCVAVPPLSHNGTIGIDKERFVPTHSVTPGKVCDLNHLVFGRWMEENDSVRFHFLGRGYPTEFRPKAPHCAFLYAPSVLFSLLRGIVAEVAIAYLLKRRGFQTSGLPDSLFEVADLKFEGKPIFLDVKHWSRQTLDRHTIREEDDDFEPSDKFSGPKFIEKAITKLNLLTKVEQDARLFYVNMMAPTDHQIEFYDSVGERCERNKARIVIIPSFLNADNPNHLSDGAEQALEIVASL